MRKFLIIPTIVMLTGMGLIIFILTHSSSKQTANHLLSTTHRLTVGDHQFDIAIATTPEQQTKGLSGITELQPNQGLYFPYNNEPNVAYWMKDMLIAIDIIWIADNKIIGISQNLQPPPPNTPDNNLTRYPAPTNQLDAVLEIAANRSAELNLKVGDEVTLEK